MIFKKFIIGLGLLAIVLATFAGSIIAVLVSNYQIPQVVLFRNTDLYDSGFNESAFKGMNKYGEATSNPVGESSVPPAEKNSTVTANKLFDNGTQTIIANSYMYMNWVLEYYPQLNTEVYDDETNPNADLAKNQYIMYVDDSDEIFFDSNKDDNIPDLYPNVISMNYHAEEATFLAALISCMYVVTQYPDDPEQWEVGIWGGLNYSAVNAIMSGYEAGIQFFNEYVLGWNNETSNIDNTVKLINRQGQTNYDTYFNKGYQDFWYSGTFEADQAGDAQALGLINEGAKVITPVAGSQTVNAINQAQIKNNNSDTEVKVVGMDVDGKKQFPNNADIFLTSAIKNIEDTVYINLLEIQAKNDPDKAAKKLEGTSYKYTSKDIKNAPFKEVWHYDTNIPDPNNLTSDDKLHGVNISDPHENDDLYDEFQSWISNPEYSEYFTNEASNKIQETDDISVALEWALEKAMEEFGPPNGNPAIPNNSGSFTSEGKSYYGWQ